MAGEKADVRKELIMGFMNIMERLGLRADPAVLVLTFFAFAFLGCMMECVVLTIETKKPVTNRGFTSHLPFCIIYGAGAIGGYFVLSPLKDSLIALFVVGAVLATAFEYIVGQMQLKLFGSFWWDYTHKPFNYKGMICLESTLGWGIVAILIVKVLYGTVTHFVGMLPARGASVLAVTLLMAYAIDFAISAHGAWEKKQAAMAREYDHDHEPYGEEMTVWE